MADDRGRPDRRRGGDDLGFVRPDVRLLGEVLAVPDRVGAEVAQVTPAAYRKRLERARRMVAQAVRDHAAAPAADDHRVAVAARELDDLARLGDLHRAHARPGSAEGALRALLRVAPTLAA